MLWFLYSLLSGFFNATSDAFVKKVKLDDIYLISWARFLFVLPLLPIFLFFTKIPTLDAVFWKTMSIFAPLDIVLLLLYIKAIRMSPLSLTLPFFSLTPVFLILTSFLILGELPTFLGVAGIILVVIGAYILNLNQKKYGILGPFKAIFKEKGTILIIIAALIASITANLLKIAVLHSSPTFFIAIHSIIFTTLMSIFFFKRIKNKFNDIKNNFGLLFLIGIANGFMFLFHALAVTLVIVPYMISIKRTSSIFGVIYGGIWFKEKYFAQRLVGAAIMVVGAVVILIS
ncbi:hypothetical protein CMO93_00940 [Candidatus Woesearchaeota archaeon]|nr:hypothetical protein [Candidatus Woesearchaeota archaeon]|tara:strand:+ start:2625 stop:3485 length:861 start_codon:yes stop_codon:yes gene_type:complete